MTLDTAIDSDERPVEMLSFDELLDAMIDVLEAAPPRQRVRQARRAVDVLTGTYLAALAGIVKPDGPNSDARRLVASDATTAAEDRRMIERAKTAGSNPEVAERVKTGDLTAGHLDALSAADRKTGGLASTDSELISGLAGTPASSASRTVNGWLEDQSDAVTSIDDRHREQRDVRLGRNFDGVPTVTINGSQPDLDALMAHIDVRADRLYEQDGGRDVASDAHRRTFAQRRFDALHELVSGPTSSDPSATGTKTGAGRPAVVVTINIDPNEGAAGRAIQAGTGPVSDRHLLRLLGQAPSMWLELIEDPTGKPLYLGRAKRHASVAQFLSLLIRDRGCVRCGAPPHRCVSHHLTPFNCPAQGPTDIDNLALLCEACHRDLHNHNYTLIRGPNNEWITRPATKDETPHPKRE